VGIGRPVTVAATAASSFRLSRRIALTRSDYVSQQWTNFLGVRRVSSVRTSFDNSISNHFLRGMNFPPSWVAIFARAHSKTAIRHVVSTVLFPLEPFLVFLRDVAGDRNTSAFTLHRLRTSPFAGPSAGSMPSLMTLTPPACATGSLPASAS